MRLVHGICLGSCHGEQVNGFLNAIHTLACYVVVCAIPLGMIVSFFAFVCLQSSFFTYSKLEMKNLRLVPNLISEDTRRGFQIFEDFFEKCITLFLISIASFYLMHLQNTYLRSCDSDILSFMLPTVRQGAELSFSMEKLFAFLPSTLNEAGKMDYTSIMAAALVAVLLSVLLGMFYSALRETAKDGVASIQRIIGNNNVVAIYDEQNIDKETVLAKLKDMTYWPVSWLKLNRFVISSIICFVVFFFYRLGLIVIGAVLMWLIVKYLFQINKQLKVD